MMISLFRRLISILRPAPNRSPRIYVDASAFDPDNDCGVDQAVIILACDEESTISERIFRAKKQSQGVVVLDQGSRDSTPYLAAQAGAIVVLREPGQSSEAAMQKAIQVAHQFSGKVQIVRN